jgi:fumarylacetoacetase
VAIGDEILDLAAAHEARLFDGLAAEAAQAGRAASLNALFALGSSARAALRHQASAILDAEGKDRVRIEGLRAQLLHRAADCRIGLPAAIGDYTDFFAGIHHATNAGKLFRPENPLLPNYKYVPGGLSRPRVIDRGIGRAGPPAQWAAQTRERDRAQLRPVARSRLRA